MIQLDGNCGTEVLARELIEGFEWEPRCLVLVMAMDNEREMFDSMLSSGRILSDPFEIAVNYTVATGSDPDVKIASTNCHNSHVLLHNYNQDRTGQEEIDELVEVREGMEMYTQLIAFMKHVINSQAMVSIDADGKASLLPSTPPNPPPPPPVDALAPPAPPEIVGPEVIVKRYEDSLEELTARSLVLIAKNNDCIIAGDRSDETVCGLSGNEAPFPWIALHNIHCRGYDTLSTREEDYCGYCKSARIQTLSISQTLFVLLPRRGFGRQSIGCRSQVAQGAIGSGPLLH